MKSNWFSIQKPINVIYQIKVEKAYDHHERYLISV